MNERREKLGEVEDRTEKMMNTSENLSSAAQGIKLKYKDKKWYQFWKFSSRFRHSHLPYFTVVQKCKLVMAAMLTQLLPSETQWCVYKVLICQSCTRWSLHKQWMHFSISWQILKHHSFLYPSPTHATWLGTYFRPKIPAAILLGSQGEAFMKDI